MTDMHMLTPFEVRLQSTELAVRDALANILHELAPLRLDAEVTGTVEIVLAEVLNNVVEHAYPSSAPDGEITVKCEHRDNSLFLEIVDQGRAMPDDKLPLGDLASLDVEQDQLPEGGFGWFLIHHLTKDVAYTRVNGENRLSLRLPIGVVG